MQSITVAGKKYLLVALGDSARNGAPAKETEGVKESSAEPVVVREVGQGDWRAEPGAASWIKNVREHHAETAAFSAPSVPPTTITCDFCTQDVLPSAWMNHQRLHFREHKNYVCPICIDRFETRQKLNLHLCRHTEPKPNVCIECGRDFLTALGLKHHRSFAHKMPKLVKVEEKIVPSS